MVPRLIDHCDQLGNSYGAAGSDFLDAAPKPIFKGDARFFAGKNKVALAPLRFCYLRHFLAGTNGGKRTSRKDRGRSEMLTPSVAAKTLLSRASLNTTHMYTTTPGQSTV